MLWLLVRKSAALSLHVITQGKPVSAVKILGTLAGWRGQSSNELRIACHA
ncbi:hypothetical protein M2401_003974 [Pseudomonas sp. JUb42]|jgi:hypothetical protein|nr:hypothetical protein [Pseudomonas sp. JUb42]MCS3470224.1 hypothetical protein [Pseudomonas sp. JUb42]